MSNFDRFFSCCEEDRLNLLHNEFINLQEVQSLQEKANEIFRLLMKALSIDMKDNLSRYNDISNQLQIKKSCHFYRNGLNDGVLLGMLLPNIKNNSGIKIL